MTAFFGPPSKEGGEGTAKNTAKARREAQEAVTAVATQFFKKLFGVENSRSVGAPSAKQRERERAAQVLPCEFWTCYCNKHADVQANIAHGNDNNLEETYCKGSREVE